MFSEDELRFELSVWRPARRMRRLDYAHFSEQKENVPPAFDATRLHEEVYHWTPGQEDVWAGVQDPDACRELRDEFVDGFAPSLVPEQRSMERFREAIGKLRKSLTSNDVNGWADAMQTAKADTSGPVNLRANATLALLHHLEWIACTFGSLPGASVTIR